MTTNELPPGAIAIAAEQIPADQPVIMVNLVRYRERADYGHHTDAPSCSGREAYFQHYVLAFNQVTGALKVEGIRPFWIGSVLASLLVPAGEQWDDVVLVEYPSFTALRRVLESPEYQAQADPHRRAALADWRFIATVKLDLPS